MSIETGDEGVEKESGFLYNSDKKELLGSILPQILRDLTLHGECTIPVDTANIINLKLLPTLQDPAPVFEYQAPVAIRDLRALLENSGALFEHVEDLCAAADCAVHRRRPLLYYGCVTLIDIFLHSNIYTNTPKIAVLANDTKLQAECAVYIAKSGHAPPSFARIFALYCSVQPSLRMSDFCVVYSESLSLIDVRRFITFGLIHGFLRRVHRYPICIERNLPGSSPQQQQPNQAPQQPQQQPNQAPQQPQQQQGGQQVVPPTSTQPGEGSGAPGGGSGNGAGSNGAGGNVSSISSTKRAMASKANQLEQDVLRMMDGGHHTDEICSKFLLRFTDVESTIQMTPNCFAVHK
ncbi:hypothetical protein PHYSODRAFT_297677 [Phytophthora sojae]|uniref:Nitrogen permease regulator 2 n=1 Tax=Phytophthora sojae (strain P6497) TaxID=1094619 RepID=G4Z0S4_PHYSP|nr:hypothetical protein PHYSODRAFT_297677 [Phytophthora sojae]EGZ26380.1 hypothetical protein PHYSODRAFT_297677 [Phytophthora sojae]|eukprot:XP_009521668.1 hypothetical protein PHYSODRAFT_297677 [Phytophthora sojae]